MRILAVWGLGKRGKGLINLIGAENVAVIIDQSTEVQETFYQGIRVVSPEKFLEEYRYYPVIITPKHFGEGIGDRLKSAGAACSFSFPDEYFSLESFFRQVSMDDLTQGYEPSEELCIWGFNVLGIVLYSLLQDRGYRCRMLRGCANDGALCHVQERFPDIQTKTKEECLNEGCRILLAERMDEADRDFFAGSRIERYYELALDRERFYDPVLEQFKGMHRGKRCFIVATGPSLTTSDLDTLYRNKEICISMNGVFTVFENTAWRPDYYMVSDNQATAKWKNEILGSDIKARFVSDTAWSFDENEKTDGIFKWHLMKESHLLKEGMEKMLPGFSDDFSRGTYSGRTITYDGALQLAVYMGFSEIYLLGVDCSYKRGSRNNYFYQEQEKDNIDHDEERMISAYRSARNYADSHGIKIYNATRGGMLEVFERVDFDSLFKGGII